MRFSAKKSKRMGGGQTTFFCPDTGQGTAITKRKYRGESCDSPALCRSEVHRPTPYIRCGMGAVLRFWDLVLYQHE